MEEEEGAVMAAVGEEAAVMGEAEEGAVAAIAAAGPAVGAEEEIAPRQALVEADRGPLNSRSLTYL